MGRGPCPAGYREQGWQRGGGPLSGAVQTYRAAVAEIERVQTTGPAMHERGSDDR